MFSINLVIEAGLFNCTTGEEEGFLLDVSFSRNYAPQQADVEKYVEFIEESLGVVFVVKDRPRLEDIEQFSDQIKEGLSEIQRRFIDYKFN